MAEIKEIHPKFKSIGKLSYLVSTKSAIEKYIDPGIPMVTISINIFSVPKSLIDLEAAINFMMIEIMKYLKLANITVKKKFRRPSFNSSQTMVSYTRFLHWMEIRKHDHSTWR